MNTTDSIKQVEYGLRTSTDHIKRFFIERTTKAFVSLFAYKRQNTCDQWLCACGSFKRKDLNKLVFSFRKDIELNNLIL